MEPTIDWVPRASGEVSGCDGRQRTRLTRGDVGQRLYPRKFRLIAHELLTSRAREAEAVPTKAQKRFAYQRWPGAEQISGLDISVTRSTIAITNIAKPWTVQARKRNWRPVPRICRPSARTFPLERLGPDGPCRIHERWYSECGFTRILELDARPSTWSTWATDRARTTFQ